MNEDTPLTFKIATEDWEFEQIHRLNHQTFAEEIPQHATSSSGRLVDKFHEENNYLICLRERELIGMMCIRARRPFSLDQKLADLDSHLPPHRSACEVRLLAVKKDCRRARVLTNLMHGLWTYTQAQGHDLVLISGNAHQQKLYEHMGCKPFGPLVGTPEALYQPMYLELNSWREAAARLKSTQFPASDACEPRNLMPGPVEVVRAVQEAIGGRPLGHRSQAYADKLKEVRESLRELTQTTYSQVLLGSGTLANDTVAGQISLLDAPGLMLKNGEFGGRLMDHARRFRLVFEVLEEAWGAPLDYERVAAYLSGHPEVVWLWAVHCETSSGIINDIERLKALCAERGVKLCLDCVSSLGMVPVNLQGVYLTSGVSGKALGSCPGLALVFHHHALTPAPDRLPRAIDLALYHDANGGVPFTGSSNLLEALRVALHRYRASDVLAETAELACWLDDELRDAGWELVGREAKPSPVITMVLPEGLSSFTFGEFLEIHGYALGFRSQYLVDRNWIQLAVMGACTRDTFKPVLKLLRQFRQGYWNKAEATELIAEETSATAVSVAP